MKKMIINNFGFCCCWCFFLYVIVVLLINNILVSNIIALAFKIDNIEWLIIKWNNTLIKTYYKKEKHIY